MITKTAFAVATTVSLLGTAQANADPYQRWIEIINHGNWAIESVHITHIRETDPYRWGDVLGGYIYPGYSAFVEPYVSEGYCRFDIMVGYEDGTEIAVWDVNLCTATKIDVSDMGYTQVSF